MADPSREAFRQEEHDPDLHAHNRLAVRVARLELARRRAATALWDAPFGTREEGKHRKRHEEANRRFDAAVEEYEAFVIGLGEPHWPEDRPA